MFFYILTALILLGSLFIGIWDAIEAKNKPSKKPFVEFIGSFFAGIAIGFFVGIVLFLFTLVFVMGAPGDFKPEESISYKITDKPELSNKTLTFHYLDGAGNIQEFSEGVNKFTVEDFNGKIITVESGAVTIPGYAPFPIRSDKYATLK